MASSAAERRRLILKTADTLRDRTAGDSGGFRVVVTGKGGVGKTTLTALLAKMFARDGADVLAIDEDPQQNLAFSLGYPKDLAREIVPLAENFDYIEEKVGARPGEGWGLFLTLNPKVSDVVERFGISIEDGLSLLVMGGVVQAATGCLCPENALLESVIRYIRLRKGEVILLDTQAGVEHFGRAIAEGFSQTVIITEPVFNAVSVALRSAHLATELGIPTIHLVVNKVRRDDDRKKVEEMLPGNHPFHSIFYLPFDEGVLDCEPDVSPLLAEATPFISGVYGIYRTVRSCGTSE